MNSVGTSMVWFEPKPSIHGVSAAAFTFGGTHLLPEFCSSAATSSARGGRLLIASPFLDGNLCGRLSPFTVDQAPGFDLVLVTTVAAARSTAADLIRRLPWRSCEILALPRLHAKLYVFEPAAGVGMALLGSHNLTAAGSSTNKEAGVLITGSTNDARDVVAGIREHILKLRSQAVPVYDSLSWPSARKCSSAYTIGV